MKGADVSMKKMCVVLLALILAVAFCASAVVSAANSEALLPEVSLGDANLDGEISIKDASEIQKHVAKLIEFTAHQKVAADLDMNDRVSVSDATYVQKIVACIVPAPQVPSTTTEAETPPATTKDYDKPIELPFVPAV